MLWHHAHNVGMCIIPHYEALSIKHSAQYHLPLHWHTLTYIDILTYHLPSLHVLINLLYKYQDTPLHHAHSCPLLPIIFQKHLKFLKSFRANLPTRHPIPQRKALKTSSAYVLQRAKHFFLTLLFSDLMSEVWQQSLLKLCCWLVTACFCSRCHTALNMHSTVTHSPFL